MHKPTVLLFLCTSLFAQTAGTIQTVAGNGNTAFSGDGGPAKQAGINVPVDVYLDNAGNMYLTDQFNNRIRKVTPGGIISTIAGNGNAGFAGDGGPAVDAELNTPTGIRGDSNGNLYIADVSNQRIRKVDASGTITTIAGNGNKGYSGDGGPAVDAGFYNPVRVALAADGNLLVADQSDHRVRLVNLSTGIVSTFAGNGAGTPQSGAFSGDKGPAVDASLNNPTALAVDAAGNVYISDQVNQRIRKVDLNGIITTIAGNGTAGYGGDGGPAIDAMLNYPGGINVDAAGNLYLNDDLNFRTRMITTDGTISSIAGTGVPGFTGDGGPALAAALNGQFGVSLDLLGNVYIADSINNRIREIYGAVPGMTPAITTAGFTNAASFTSGGSPGAIATLFGSHLTRNLQGIVQNSGAPLPASLAGTSLTIGGETAPIFNVVDLNGKEQISFQIPVDASANSPLSVELNNGFASATIQVPLTAVQPGIFIINGNQAAALHTDYSIVTTSSPAAPGETILLYCTGLGAVSPVVATGAAASSTVLSRTSATFTATIAGLDASVSFSGLAPGFVGLGQINLTVPTNAPSGLQDLVITGAGISSNSAKIQIQ